MIRAAIVEDDSASLQHLNELFLRYRQETHEEVQISSFKNSEMFLTRYRPVYDVVFMDIDLPGINGMEAAKLLLADEPTTALDVTIQAQVLDLMIDLKDKLDTSMIFITHDLGIIAEICDRVAVMYAGRIIEEGTLEDVFNRTKHPYTEGLFNSLPNIEDRFAKRCLYAEEGCFAKCPQLVEVRPNHFVACCKFGVPEA